MLGLAWVALIVCMEEMKWTSQSPIIIDNLLCAIQFISGVPASYHCQSEHHLLKVVEGGVVETVLGEGASSKYLFQKLSVIALLILAEMPKFVRAKGSCPRLSGRPG